MDPIFSGHPPPLIHLQSVLGSSTSTQCSALRVHQAQSPLEATTASLLLSATLSESLHSHVGIELTEERKHTPTRTVIVMLL